jgi:hypothetical protein
MLGHNEPKASDEFLFPFDRNPRCFSASGAQKKIGKICLTLLI